MGLCAEGVDASLEDLACGSREADGGVAVRGGIVCEVHAERTARHADLEVAAVGLQHAVRHQGRGRGAGAAGQCFANAALPDAYFYIMFVKNLGKFNVGSGGKNGVKSSCCKTVGAWAALSGRGNWCNNIVSVVGYGSRGLSEHGDICVI